MPPLKCLLQDMIRMASDVNFNNLNQHVEFFTNHMEGLPNRLASCYSVYRFFARKLIDLVDDGIVVSTIDLDAYLKDKFIPYVKEIYAGSSSNWDNINSFMSAIINTIKVKGTSIDSVSSWLKPKAVCRQSIHGDTVHLGISKMRDFLLKEGVTVNTVSIKAIVNRIPGANTKFCTCFVGTNQESCWKIPRQAFEADVFQRLDELFSQEENEERTGEGNAPTAQEDPVNEEVEALKIELRTTSSLVEDLKKKQEVEIKALEDKYTVQIRDKDGQISSLKRQLNEALEKPIRAETGTQTPCGAATTTSPVVNTLNTLMSEGTCTSNLLFNYILKRIWFNGSSPSYVIPYTNGNSTSVPENH
ncbi:Hypothetical predicted protein [Paramuricea clavata]|uniref:Uncharacterized protein n=1 Tax=Paramuricea clavata TaxID=317549 RepID=A0A6S7J2C9_PARCT|nr:Hypothetical predicted protein [Paramuricea clavata]